MVVHIVEGVPRGRGGVSAFLGSFTRQHLIDNGPSNPTDMHNRLKGILDLAVTPKGNPWRISTIKSYLMWIHMAARLGLMERITETEPRVRDTEFLTERVFYQITQLGRDREDLWLSVRKELYPVDPETKKQYSARAREKSKDRRARLEELKPPEAEVTPISVPLKEEEMQEIIQRFLRETTPEERRAISERIQGQRGEGAEIPTLGPFTEEIPPSEIAPTETPRREPTATQERLRIEFAEDLERLAETEEPPVEFV